MPDQIKKTTSYDPSTGETTFKASWSSQGQKISRGPVTPKPTQRTVAARQISNPASKMVASRSESAGQRIAVAFKSPTMADRTDKPEIKSSANVQVPTTPLTRKEIFDIKTNLETEKLKQRFPGVSIDEAKRLKQKEIDKASKESAKKSGYQRNTGGDNSSKQTDARSCRGC